MNTNLHAFRITSAFKGIVEKLSLLPSTERACWGITSMDNVETIVRAFEYYMKNCEAGQEQASYEGFRQFIIGRADRLAKIYEQRAKYRALDDHAIEDEKEAA